MNEKISLTELQLIIRDSLYMSLPEMFWVVAEISELKENSAGHCYLELIEKQADDTNIRARIKAIIWSNRYRFLKSLFENVTGETVREGLKILVKAKVEYHEIYGLSLVITDIDPAFTIGELAMKRQLIINRLRSEGIFTMNKELDIPAFPQKIAVISSKNAAGYTDFINHLNGNRFNYVFHTALFESAMQGTDTEHGIINALNRIADYQDLFDLVVIIRGGGSQTDLSWFDNYNIAYHITQFPLPVITGIGHEKDLSVTDMVANIALKTPTATADFIISQTVDTETHLSEICFSIKELSGKIIDKNKTRLESAITKLQPLTRIMIAGIKENITEKIIRIINTGKEFTFRSSAIPGNQKSRLKSAAKSFSNDKRADMERYNQILRSLAFSFIGIHQTKISSHENTLNILNPVNVLKRGYTITSLNGKIITKKEKLETDDIIDTQFIDGMIKSRVMGKAKIKNDGITE